MADDARISTALPRHPKTVKLERRLGPAGFRSLVCLFLWVAENRPTGDLAGMSDEDIEISADWSATPGEFVRTVAEVRFLDGQEGTYKIHDWAEHNPWAAGRPGRIEKARVAAIARWARWEGQQRECDTDAPSMLPACSEHVLAMPTSPHLTSPPDTTKTPPPVEESVFVLEENARAREAGETPREYSQKDFDERDLKLMAKARQAARERPSSVGSLDDKGFFVWICAQAGITVERGLYLEELQYSWPEKTA